jgi:hypothetical protein
VDLEDANGDEWEWVEAMGKWVPAVRLGAKHYVRRTQLMRQ